MPIITITAMAGGPMDDFLWRAILGAALLGAACGPIGCFVLWRRMAYLGESIAHMGLLGAGLGLLIGVNVVAGVAALGIVAALLMARAENGAIPAGTFIGIVGHVGLALGFILLAGMETVRADLMGYLFGDVLALSSDDLLLAALVCAAILGVTALLWRRLLAFTVSPEIARAEKRHGKFAEVAFLVVIALLVAVGLKIVGALLIIALILIPPAAARPLARTPEAMAILAALIGALSAPLGIAGALISDAPAGPCIVLAAAALFALTGIAARLRRA
jgi:zinc transport system permease protein